MNWRPEAFFYKYVTSHRGRGNFFCSACDGDRPYHEKHVWRYFSLFGIPFLPLKKTIAFIECQDCRQAYKSTILSLDRKEMEEQVSSKYYQVLQKIMVSMMLLGDRIDDRAIGIASEIYQSVSGEVLGELAIKQLAEESLENPQTIVEILDGMQFILDNNARETLVRAAFYVAAADGELTTARTRHLKNIGCALQMTPVYVRGIIEDVLDQAE